LNINDKKQSVKLVKDKLKSSQAFFITHNLGLKSEEMNSLRKEVRKGEGELKVVKNTILRRALEDFDYKSEILDDITGPVVVAFSYGDPVPVAKAVVKIIEDKKKIEIKNGILGTNKIDAKQIESLSKLPGREELIQKFVWTVAAPLSNFMGVLTAVPRDFVNVLTAIKDNK
jgi:large subunit ribosomal protein L10